MVMSGIIIKLKLLLAARPFFVSDVGKLTSLAMAFLAI